MNKTNLISSILGIIFCLALILYYASSSVFTIFLHFFLLISGLTISILLINRITKSSNSLKSKIHFSFIISFVIFFSIIFFWYLGDISRVGQDWKVTLPVVSSVLLFYMMGSITGLILSVKRKKRNDFDYNIKPFLLITTVISAILLLVFFYNPLVLNLSKLSNDADLCRLSISLHSSYMFPLISESSCFMKVAVDKEDDTICERVHDANKMSICYHNIAMAKKDVNVCLRGNQFGAKDMDFCVLLIAERTKKPQLCEYLSGGNNYIEGLENSFSSDWDRNYCISLIASVMKNKDLCNTIKDEKERNRCLEQFMRREE